MPFGTMNYFYIDCTLSLYNHQVFQSQTHWSIERIILFGNVPLVIAFKSDSHEMMSLAVQLCD